MVTVSSITRRYRYTLNIIKIGQKIDFISKNPFNKEKVRSTVPVHAGGFAEILAKTVQNSSFLLDERTCKLDNKMDFSGQKTSRTQ